MNPEKTLVLQFIMRCRALAKRRLVVCAVADACLFIASLTGASIAITHWTLRGDFAALFWQIGAILGLCGCIAYVVHTISKYWSHPLVVAKHIVSSKIPLFQNGNSLPDSVALRHEILAAVQLLYGHKSAPHQSDQLAQAYIDQVGQRLQAIASFEAIQATHWQLRLAFATGIATIIVGLALHPASQLAWFRLIDRQDARPEPEPEPLWDHLQLRLQYPQHTHRRDKTIVNFSGSILVPSGTAIHLTMQTAQVNRAAQILIFTEKTDERDIKPPQKIPLTEIPSPKSPPRHDDSVVTLEGTFQVVTPGRWRIVVPRNWDEKAIARRSSDTAIDIETDNPPEIELHALENPQLRIDDTDHVDLKFNAIDDFGLSRATLIYMWPNGESHEIPIGVANEGQRNWNHRYSWDLSAIPMEHRSELTYWIEIRDNDPGLGPDGPFDPIGKVTRSVQRQLKLRDHETIHAENIESMQHIRDFAVDLLAARMQTDLFISPVERENYRSIVERINTIHQSANHLLTLLASAVDAYALDKHARERDIRTIAAIHERLYEHQDGAKEIFSVLPDDFSSSRSDFSIRGFGRFFGQIRRNNERQISALEDELIRLDDLVDEQLIERIDLLLARLQATQQKLVELLEQLASGDESVRGQIELLQQKAKLDLARINQARSQLSKELGREFINQDAFRAMEARMRFMELSERLRNGDTEGALRQARESLEQLQKFRGSIQDRLAQSSAEESRLSPEAQARMKLLRELGKLKDQQTGIAQETRKLAKHWKEELQKLKVGSSVSKQIASSATQAKQQIEKINDARLGREGRHALDDLQQTLKDLSKQSETENSSIVDNYQKLREANRLIKQAQTNSESSEDEGKILRSLAQKFDQLERKIREEIPQSKSIFDEQSMSKFSQLNETQRNLRSSVQQLLQSEQVEILPENGQSALQEARKRMRGSSDDLSLQLPIPALDEQGAGTNSIQQAIDSLQQANPPPPTNANEKSSTEASQDRSLREQVIEAMRQSGTKSLDKTAERYYEELLR